MVCGRRRVAGTRLLGPYLGLWRTTFLNEWRTQFQFSLGIPMHLARKLLAAGSYFFISFWVPDLSARTQADYGMSFVNYVIIGLVVQGLLFACSSGLYNSLLSLFLERTLELGARQGLSPFPLAFGKLLPRLTGALFDVVVYGLVGIVFFGLRVPLRLAVSCLPVLALGACAELALGIWICMPFLVSGWARTGGNPLVILYGSVSQLLTGVLFPVTVLPAAVQSVALCLPLSHCVRAVRAILGGGSLGDVTGDLVYLAVFAVMGMALGHVALRLGMKRVLREGLVPQSGGYLYMY